MPPLPEKPEGRCEKVDVWGSVWGSMRGGEAAHGQVAAHIAEGVQKRAGTRMSVWAVCSPLGSRLTWE